MTARRISLARIVSKPIAANRIDSSNSLKYFRDMMWLSCRTTFIMEDGDESHWLPPPFFLDLDFEDEAAAA